MFRALATIFILSDERFSRSLRLSVSPSLFAAASRKQTPGTTFWNGIGSNEVIQRLLNTVRR
jgi:hypothetical protein